jgi:aryl-phospho-beta-D-glucosidase BglC (GH1 family)
MMKGELSHGLPNLFISGNQIVGSDNTTPVLLRGLNRSGLEYSEPGTDGFLAAAQISQDEIGVMVSDWRANILRIPFNQDWCLHGRGGHSAEAYLGSLDQVIDWAASMGAYTILDLQWLDIETAYGTTSNATQGRTVNHVPPTPNEKTIELWRILAARYQHESAVIFDLLNEPHDRLPDDPNPLLLIGSDGRVTASDQTHLSAQDWNRWASLLTAEVRKIKPDSLIFVGGVDWAFDLRGVQVEAPNIVYSTHIYANRPWFTWGRGLGRYRDVPIFAGEWGGSDGELKFGRRLATKLRRRGLGWTAWSWSDFPRLVSSAQQQDFTPTAFGAFVRDEIRSATA